MNGTTIMICDDNETVHQTLQLYLKEAGFRVISAYDKYERDAASKKYRVSDKKQGEDKK